MAIGGHPQAQARHSQASSPELRKRHGADALRHGVSP
jgi:hypothetical protein